MAGLPLPATIEEELEDDFLEDTAAILHVLWNGISFQGIMAPDRLDSDEICRLTRRVLNTIATRVQTHLASRRAVI
jgi:hypothetical protein